LLERRRTNATAYKPSVLALDRIGSPKVELPVRAPISERKADRHGSAAHDGAPSGRRPVATSGDRAEATLGDWATLYQELLAALSTIVADESASETGIREQIQSLIAVHRDRRPATPALSELDPEHSARGLKRSRISPQFKVKPGCQARPLPPLANLAPAPGFRTMSTPAPKILLPRGSLLKQVD
jgi:hypothetical protein